MRVPDVARLGPIRRALGAVENASVYQPAYALTDPGPARRAARAEALARMRAEAEAYAAALNMRVLRIVRITERAGADLFSMSSAKRRADAPGVRPERHSDPETDVAVIVASISRRSELGGRLIRPVLLALAATQARGATAALRCGGARKPAGAARLQL